MTRHLVFAAVLFLLTGQAFTQDKKADKAAALKSLVSGKHFVFSAQTALPSSGRTRQLTSSYSLTVSGDSVISDLPYFGRAYSAPIDVTQSPLQFTSTKFTYSVISTKRGGIEVDMKFDDVREVQTMSMTLSRDGYGMLRVQPTNRQGISFNGVAAKK